MKKLIYIPVLLVFAFQLKSIGQSMIVKENVNLQGSLPAPASPSVIVKENIKLHGTISDTSYINALFAEASYYDSLSERVWEESKKTKKISKEIMIHKAVELRQISLSKQIEASSLAADISCENEISFTLCLSELLKQTYYYDSLSSELSYAMQHAPGVSKELMEEKAADLHEKAITKQIEISALSHNITYLQFYQNASSIDSLINEIMDGGISSNRPESLNTQAEAYLKRAKEMREEANSLHTKEAMLGAMLNAEEQESLALRKQSELINSLLFIIPSTL